MACNTWMGLRQGCEVDVWWWHWRTFIAAAEMMLEEGIVRCVQVSAHADHALCAEGG